MSLIEKVSKESVCKTIERQTDAPPTKLHEIDSGLDHWVFSARWKGQNVVVRVPKTSAYRSKLKRTADACSQLTKKGIPFPKPLFVGKDFVIETRLRGKSVSETSLTTAEKETVYFRVGRILRKLHSIRRKGYGEILPTGDGKYGDWTSVLKKGVQSTLRKFSEKKFLSPEGFERMQTIFRKDLSFRSKGSLLHGDIKPVHLFVHGKKLSGIVDASDLMVGDPMYEFGEIQLQLMDDPAFESLVKGYGRVNRKKALAYAIFTLAWRVDRYKDGRKRRIAKIRKLMDWYASQASPQVSR